ALVIVVDAAQSRSATGHSATGRVKKVIARAVKRASATARRAAAKLSAPVRSVTGRAKRVTARAATVHVAKNLSVTVRSATGPVKTVTAHAVSALRETSPVAASRPVNPASASHLSENRASVANVRVSQAR